MHDKKKGARFYPDAFLFNASLSRSIYAERYRRSPAASTARVV
jgi:hypothetical protein